MCVGGREVRQWKQVVKGGGEMLRVPEAVGTSLSTTMGFLKSCQQQVSTLPRAFRTTMGHVQQGRAGDIHRHGCLALQDEEPPSRDGQEGLSRDGGFLDPRKCPQ